MAAMNWGGMFDAFSALNEKTWKYDRNASLGASEVFTCIRKSFFKKFGYEPDDDHEQDWGAAKRGDILENEVGVPMVNAILAGNAELILAGDDQETLKKGRLSATPDGLVIGADRDALKELGIEDIESDCFVVEFKSFDPRANIKEEKSVHRGQTQVQMGLIRELMGYKPVYAVIIYINASILSDIRPFVVKWDPEVYKTAKKRAKQVFETQEPSELMAEGKVSGDCSLCEFTEECAIAQGLLVPRDKKVIKDDTVLEEIATLSQEQKRLQAEEKDAKQRRVIVEEQIKQILRDHSTKSVGTDVVSVNLAWCSGKKSVDLLAMAADGIDVKKYEKEGAGYERLTVKLKE